VEFVGRVASLAEPVVQEAGCELVEVQFQRESRGWILRLIIDNDKGVTLDDCVRVSREVGNLLEIEDVIDQAYNLEVSSPGLDRPLRGPEDFKRFQGRQAKVVTKESIDRQHVFIGRIESVENNDVIALKTEHGTVRIPYSQVSKARLEIEL